MPKALWIAHVKVTDVDSYMKYAEIATKVIPEFGGRFTVRNGAYEQLEGNDRARNVVAEFPSLQAAHDCYHSEGYQEALSHACEASERDLVIVECLE